MAKLKDVLWKYSVKQEELDWLYEILVKRGVYSEKEIAFHLSRFAEAKAKGRILQEFGEIEV